MVQLQPGGGINSRPPRSCHNGCLREQPPIDVAREKILSLPDETRFAAQWPGSFAWQHLVKGPDEFRVKITKLKPAEPVASSCGGR